MSRVMRKPGFGVSDQVSCTVKVDGLRFAILDFEGNGILLSM